MSACTVGRASQMLQLLNVQVRWPFHSSQQASVLVSLETVQDKRVEDVTSVLASTPTPSVVCSLS